MQQDRVIYLYAKASAFEFSGVSKTWNNWSYFKEEHHFNSFSSGTEEFLPGKIIAIIYSINHYLAYPRFFVFG